MLSSVLNAMPYYFLAGSFIVLLVAVLARSTIKILREYERAVVFTLGRFQQAEGPGLVLLIPFVQEMVRVDLRIQVVEIPTQDVISRDNVSMKVDAVLYCQRRSKTEPPGAWATGRKLSHAGSGYLGSALAFGTTPPFLLSRSR